MEKEKTLEDLKAFVKDSEFVYGDFWDFETNVRVYVDAISFMNWSWYIESMWNAIYWEDSYIIADYYDDIVKDVIVFDTEIHWNFMNSAQEVAEYLWNLNELYEDKKKQYESYYTVNQSLTKIFRLFTN